MSNDSRPPSFQWYPRDFAGNPGVAAMPDWCELAYRRALDASWIEEAYGVGSPDDWCRWGRIAPAQRTLFLAMLAPCVEVQPDGTLAQVRMARERMTQAIRYAQASRGARSTNAARTDSERTASAQRAHTAAPASASASAFSPSRNKESEPKTRAAPAAFTRPSLPEIEAYCQERALAGHRRVDPLAWRDHYEANGWKVGKNPMKDWRAAVRTWERNGHENGNGNQPTGQSAAEDWLRRKKAEAAL